METLLLYNPKSNWGKAKDIIENHRNEFERRNIPMVDVTKVNDISTFLREKNPQLLAIGGGDGTINSIVTATLKINLDPTFLIFPLGFGNALSYCFGTETMEKAFHVLDTKPDTITIDVMKTNIDKFPYGLFNISLGFDARIIHERHNDPLGFKSYTLSAVSGLFSHKNKPLTIVIDDKTTVRTTAASFMISNGPVIGKNVVVAEEAKLDDGFLECTIFPSRLSYVNNLKKLPVNPLENEVGRTRFKAKSLHIEGETPVQVDGDPAAFEHFLEVSVVPQTVTFLTNVQNR